jgi:hypothetical protein
LRLGASSGSTTSFVAPVVVGATSVGIGIDSDKKSEILLEIIDALHRLNDNSWTGFLFCGATLNSSMLPRILSKVFVKRSSDIVAI